MAACDNLYGNKKEWIELRDFLLDNYPKAAWYMNHKPQLEDVHVRICYIADIQEWLIENCPFK